MKYKTRIVTSMCVTASLALTSLAQDTSNMNTNFPSKLYGALPQLKATAKASDIIGMDVRNYQGDKLGKIQDLAIDVESGRIVEVILSSGGILGMGAIQTAVPPSSFNCDTNSHYLLIDASMQKIKEAPKFDSSDWDATTQSNRISEVYGYYNEQPYFIANNGYWSTNADGTISNNLPLHMDGSANTQGARTMDTLHNIEIAGTNSAEAMDYSYIQH